MATHSSILAQRIPMDRGAWRATVHGIGKSRTGLSNSTAQQRLWASKQEPTSLNLLTHQSKSASLTTTDSVKLPVLCMSSGWLLSYQNACATLYCHSEQHHSNSQHFSFIWACMYMRSVTSDSLPPRGLQPARILCPLDFPGTNTGVGCYVFLQGIFPIRGSNPQLLCHLHGRWVLQVR